MSGSLPFPAKKKTPKMVMVEVWRLQPLLQPLLFLLLPLLLTSQTHPPERFSDLEYRSVGPTRGGRATAIAGIPERPFTFFFGSTGGGVWKTEDAGTTWRNISDGQIEAGSIGAIAVAPSDESTLYVGTGSACPRGNISPGIGLYKSMDGGKKWTHTGLPDAGQIGKIEVHPDNPNLVYVAALGQIFGPNPERGVFRSKDGGQNWKKVLYISDSTGVVDLAMNPHNPREIYAAAWRAERKPWTLIDGGHEGGIWKTMDGGDTWTKLEGGLPTGLLGKIGLAISPVNPERVWALVMAADEEKGGLYRSDDAGASWTRICRDHQLRQRGWYYTHITAHPTDENTLFANNVRFFKSIDGGKTFERIGTPHGDNHDVWINPNQPDIMVQCNDGGACVTLNGGKTWSTQLNQPTSEFYRVTVDDQFPYRLYAGQQDNTTISVPSHGMYGLTETEHWFDVGGGESADVGVNPENPDIIWAGTYSGEITILNRKTGHVRQVTAYPHYTEGTEMRDLKYRWQWNFPIVVSQHDPNVIYHTSNYVHRTTDDGQTWERISPDLTRAIDKYFDIPGGPIQHDATGVEVYSSIFAFEESPHQAGLLWAGSDDGRVHLSRDGGENWTEITPKGMPYEGTVNKIELSTHEPGRAFIAVYNYRYNDFKPYIYRTDNYGQSWTPLTDGSNGIPDDHFVRAIAEDPARKGLLYAGTEFGMYVSFDDGAQWQPLQLNLPHTPITDLEVHEGDLVLSTQGRAFWILDDLSVLRQRTSEVAKADKHLFAPRPAYRTEVAGYNPRFYLYLHEQPDDQDEAKMEILDESGQLIRTYTTTAENRRKKIDLQKGLNTLGWDLLHEGPEMVDNLVTMVIPNPAPGPQAVPGKYQVRITIGDWIQTQSFEVRPDPRWTNVTQDDYEAQLALGLEVRDLIHEAHQRIKNLRALREQINDIAGRAEKAGHGTEFKEMTKEIDRQLTAVEDQLIQNKAEASQDNINYPRVFSNHIGRLYTVLIYDQHRPTGGMLERYEDLKKEYAGIVADYEEVMREAVPQFNELLAQEKVERLILPEKIE